MHCPWPEIIGEINTSIGLMGNSEETTQSTKQTQAHITSITPSLHWPGVGGVEIPNGGSTIIGNKTADKLKRHTLEVTACGPVAKTAGKRWQIEEEQTAQVVLPTAGLNFNVCYHPWHHKPKRSDQNSLKTHMIHLRRGALWNRSRFGT